MYLKTIVTAIYLLLTSVLLTAQTSFKLPGLNVGDMMPDITFDYLYNYPGNKAKLSDFKGKLVILDFWNMGCSPCIASFPKLQQLQQQFDGKIQIILVNDINTRKDLDKIGFPDKTQISLINNNRLPVNIENKVLDELIARSSLPYHVWINGNGKIVAKMHGIHTTAKRIENFLSGKPTSFVYKPTLEDVGLSWPSGGNTYKSILQPKSKSVFDNLLFSSIITRDIGNKGFSGLLYDSASRKLVGLRTSGSALQLFRQATGSMEFISNPDRIILEVDNKEDYIKSGSLTKEQKSEWEEKNKFSYEIKFPVERMSSDNSKNSAFINAMLGQDLERFLGVKASIKKRKLMCRILVREGTEDKLSSKSKEASYFDQLSTGEPALFMKRGYINNIIDNLKYCLLDTNIMPFLDETGYPLDKLIDIDINSPLTDLNAVRKELKRYGLAIVEAERELNVLVIKKDL